MRSLHLFLDLLAHWWHRATSSRYVLMLEARVRQLEQDNAGLRDTVFGLRGLPPMPRGVPAAFTASTAAPMAAQEAPAIKPKVDSIHPSRADLAQRARKEALDAGKREREGALDVIATRNAYLAEVERERAASSGVGYAVTEAGGPVVKIQDGLAGTPAETE